MRPVKVVTSDSPDQPGNSESLDRSAVAARAYELWQRRGCPIGSDQEDWLQAEQELENRTAATAIPLLAKDARFKRSSSRTGWFSVCIGNPFALLAGMKQISLTIPEIVLIGGTRVALGVGIGLLLSDRINKDQRRGAGWALFGVGVLTTLPILLGIAGKRAAAEGPGALIA
jgi:hypothetical protein